MAAKLLTRDAVEKRLAEVPDWKHEGNAIIRELVFRNFREAVAFLVRIAFDAEEADHHPDVSLSYKRLRLSLSTHSEGGLTDKDFDLAAKIDRIFGARS
jgi:4a-hydroxytetrahydrobiopterin dehydratase